MPVQNQFNTLLVKKSTQGPAVCEALAPSQGFSQWRMMNEQHPEEPALPGLCKHPVQGLQLGPPQTSHCKKGRRWPGRGQANKGDMATNPQRGKYIIRRVAGMLPCIGSKIWQPMGKGFFPGCPDVGLVITGNNGNLFRRSKI